MESYVDIVLQWVYALSSVIGRSATLLQGAYIRDVFWRMLELLRNVTKWPCRHIRGRESWRCGPGVLASTSSCVSVVISLVFLLCSQNDCINSAVGDSDIGSGVSVTVFCCLLFLFGLWPILFFVGTCRRVHLLAFGFTDLSVSVLAVSAWDVHAGLVNLGFWFLR